MTTFADFALLGTVPSYGAAQVLRARRVLLRGEGPAVHLALLGDSADLIAVAVAVAEAAAGASDARVPPIHEVGRFLGAGYAVADACDGVDLQGVFSHDRNNNKLPGAAFSLAITLQLAQLALDLHERGEVWAAEGGAGLSTLFPSGLPLDGVLLRVDGSVVVRVLAGVVADPARPSPFYAPELRHGRPSAASDVFVIAQLLRALLTGDATVQSAPRLVGLAASLGGVLSGGLREIPDDRTTLPKFAERLASALSSTFSEVSAPAAIADVLRHVYRLLPASADPDAEVAPLAIGLRPRLGMVRATLRIMWPPEVAPVADERQSTEVHSRFAAGGQASSTVGRVFTEEQAPVRLAVPLPVGGRRVALVTLADASSESDDPAATRGPGAALLLGLRDGGQKPDGVPRQPAAAGEGLRADTIEGNCVPLSLTSSEVVLLETAPIRAALVQPVSARLETAATRAARVEGARVEGARVEGARAEGARVEGARVEAARVESARVEAARVEGARAEGARVKAARVKGARVEGARVEAARVEAARVEVARVKPARVDAARFEDDDFETETIGPAVLQAAAVQVNTIPTVPFGVALLQAAQVASAPSKAAAGAAHVNATKVEARGAPPANLSQLDEDDSLVTMSDDATTPMKSGKS